MEAAFATLRQYASNLGDIARHQLITSLHEFAYSLEDPNDTVHRFGYLHLQTAAVKTGFDLDLFRTLKNSDGPLTVAQIAEKTGGEPAFFSRFLSYLASIGAIKETGKDEFAANHITNNLSENVTEAGITHCFETIGPVYQTLPAFLKKTNYKNPVDENNTVFQDAWNTDKHTFKWFTDNPENLRHFNDYMRFRREPVLSWLSVYPVEQETQGLDPSRAVYVNIGGGVGHQCAQFKEKYPSVPGRVILQDMPHSIAKALPTPGVENMAHDFFQPQPIQGAKLYFTRGVCHNHPDHKVKLLLQNIKAAMAPDSVLLLDEWVLPETGVSSYASSMDLVMMASFAALERTEAQWQQLLSEVGLKLVKTYPYNPVSYEAVMDIRLP